MGIIQGPWTRQPERRPPSAPTPGAVEDLDPAGKVCEWCEEPAVVKYVVREYKQDGILKRVRAWACVKHRDRFNRQKAEAEEAARRKREEARKKRGR